MGGSPVIKINLGGMLVNCRIIIEDVKFKKLTLVGREGESREWFQWS